MSETITLEIFPEPRTLSCGHTVTITEVDAFICPACAKKQEEQKQKLGKLKIWPL